MKKRLFNDRISEFLLSRYFSEAAKSKVLLMSWTSWLRCMFGLYQLVNNFKCSFLKIMQKNIFLCWCLFDDFLKRACFSRNKNVRTVNSVTRESIKNFQVVWKTPSVEILSYIFKVVKQLLFYNELIYNLLAFCGKADIFPSSNVRSSLVPGVLVVISWKTHNRTNKK